jgi:peptidoglycan/xylan/chitin deacetylase (PgdA/CDA1 family)
MRRHCHDVRPGVTRAALITLDVHPHAAIERCLDAALDELARLAIPATFFVAGAVAQALPATIRRIVDAGHEVGCHGLLHNAREWNGLAPEYYDALPENEQRRRLAIASAVLEHVTGRKMTAFRAPVFRVSGMTLRLLDELGYRADVSVNAQRLDLLSAEPFSVKQLTAPRLPYHPSVASAFRRGNLGIWEIPLSCAGVPLAIMTAATLRPALTRALLRLLQWESRLTGKPLVYMAHPEEFSREDAATYTDGRHPRRVFSTRDPRRLHAYNRGIIEAIVGSREVECVTVGGYVERWLDASASLSATL